MKLRAPSQLQLTEAAAGLLALALPTLESPTAGVLAVLGAVFVALLLIWPSAVSRSAVGLAVIGNALTIPQREAVSSVLLWLDAVLLCGFLLVGAAVEAGMRRWDDASASWWSRQLTRVSGVALVLVALVAAAWLRPGGSLWLVFAGMAAALAVLVLARQAGTEREERRG